jgi:hypothetical protein
MIRLLVFLAALGICCCATACINDNESPQHEREFRSQYLVSRSPLRVPASRINERLYVTAGSALLVGAFAVALSRPKERSKPCDLDSGDFS